MIHTFNVLSEFRCTVHDSGSEGDALISVGATNDGNMEKFFIGHLNTGILANEVAINGRKPISSSRCVDCSVQSSEGQSSQTAKSIHSICTAGVVDDGVVVRLVVVRAIAALIWNTF